MLSPEKAHVTFRTMLDPPLSSTLSTPTSSSLLLSQNRTNSCAPPAGLWFGRFTEQSPLTGCATLRSKLAVFRKRRRSYLQGKTALDRLTTLAKTSLLLLRYRRWMKDQICECWPLHCYHRRERQVRTHSEFITLTEQVLRLLFRTIVPALGNP